MYISKWLWLTVITLLLMGFACYVHSIMIPEDLPEKKNNYKYKGLLLIFMVLVLAFVIHYKEHRTIK